MVTLAQEGAAEAPAPAGDPAAPVPPAASMMTLFLPILVAFAVMTWLSTRQQRKEQGRRTNMIRTLKKNDSVVTIGGIIGSVVSVSEDGAEVTLRMVDDARIKFRADAIRDVLTKPDATPAKPAG
ncbi:MAG: preprotein translocase subunit YajC [Planctomyces sp.]|nr:preprotein translocase subunit YajC [Planctomyces sp.]